MPDKKLTDNEIIKALKEILEIMCVMGDLQKASTISNALDLINRLQASKEHYQKMNARNLDNVMYLSKQCDELQAENERSKEQVKFADNYMNNLDKPLQEFRAEAKAEAYKEFAELAVERVEKAKQKYQRLCKEQGEEMEEAMHIHFNGITKIINNLLKELVGGENGEES